MYEILDDMSASKHTSWTAKVTGYLRRGPGTLSHVIKSRPSAVHCEINLLLNANKTWLTFLRAFSSRFLRVITLRVNALVLCVTDGKRKLLHGS
jgi:hypothetical protein